MISRKIKKSAIAIAVLHSFASAANAAIYTVDSTLDLPVNRTDGNCTLREAIERAQLDDGVTGNDCNPIGDDEPDVIQFSFSTPQTITLANQGEVINSALFIDEDLTITGPESPNQVTIDGNFDSSIFDISNADAANNLISDVVIENLILTGGSSSSSSGAVIAGVNTDVTINGVSARGNRGSAGGAIRVSPQASVAINQSTIEMNSSGGRGGAIFVATEGDLTITDSTLSENFSGSSGGAIYAQAPVVLENTTISSNSAEGNGGGVYATESLSIRLNSAVSNNRLTSGGSGGGIYARGQYLALFSSSVTGNVIDGSGVSSGGGIFANNLSDIVLYGSSVSNNTAGLRGGGMYVNNSTLYMYTVNISNNLLNQGVNRGGGAFLSVNSAELDELQINNNTASIGGGIQLSGAVSIDDSTINGNSATSGGGGGIYNNFADLDLTRSTVSNNFASSGGGLYLRNETTRIINSTISSNSNTQNSGGIRNGNNAYLRLYNSTVAYNGGQGNNGVQSFGLLRISNSILAGNEANDCEAGDYARVFREGVNLVESNSGCTAEGVEFTFQGQSAELSPLQDNGGVTFTHGLCPESPAINAGEQATCDTRFIAVDQRNEDRNDGSCDIGAYELIAPLSCEMPSSLFVVPIPGKGAAIFEL